MDFRLFVFTFLSSVVVIYLTTKVLRNRKRRSKLLNRLGLSINKESFKHLNFAESTSNSLMANPENNIKIGPWDSEKELREKADIHRARLNRFGKSKINGEMLFLSAKGSVYRFSNEGKKIYV